MSEQDRIAFEKWYHEYINTEYSAQAFINNMFEAWNAATTESNKRIAELESEIAELKRDRDEWKDSTISANRRFEISEHSERELKADNNALREAIRKIEFEYDYCSDAGMTNAVKESMTLLAASPAHSLIDFENSIIDRCADVADYMPLNADEIHEYRASDDSKAMAWDISCAINALKQEVK